MKSIFLKITFQKYSLLMIFKKFCFFTIVYLYCLLILGMFISITKLQNKERIKDILH